MIKKLFLLTSTLLLTSAFCLLPSASFAVDGTPDDGDTYKPISPSKLREEVDYFYNLGAEGYLIWQFSGPRVNPRGNDQYSFFSDIEPGPSICQEMAFLNKKYSNKEIGVGVNMYDIGNFDDNYIKAQFSWLKGCGVKTVRIFADKSGGATGVQRALAAASAADIKLIITIGDYSNGGGGIPQGAGPNWYAGGYQGEYMSFLRSIGSVAAGHPGLYGIELANEPHCGGHPDGTVNAYRNWVSIASSQLKNAGISRVGIGQMASQAGSSCDHPARDTGGGSNDFSYTNNVSTINMTSGHYYNEEEKGLVSLAAGHSKALGKTFYIGEASVGGQGGSTFTSSDYYLYPINGLLRNQPESFYRDLVAQGYQSHCMVPKINILGDVEEVADTVLQQIGSQYITVQTEQHFDYSGVEVPILRDQQSVPALFNSIEDYWGYQNLTVEDPIERKIASAPIYSLLTEREQCIQQTKILEAVENMCQKLLDPRTCSLNKAVPESSWTMLELREQLRLNPGLTCSRIAEGDELNESEQAVADSLKNVPLYIDNAYRLAFLVVAAEVRTPPASQPPFPSFNFIPSYFFSENNANPVLTDHDVRVIAFRIPDVGTNKDENSDIYYEDALQLTANAVTKDDYQRAIKEKVREDKSIEWLNERETEEPLVNAHGSEYFESSDFVKALVDFVNKRTLGAPCEANDEDLPFEEVNSIKDSGELSESDNAEHDLLFQEGDVLEKLESENIVQTTSSEELGEDSILPFQFFSQFGIGAVNKGPGDSKFVSYLIIPQGYEMERVTDSILGAFFKSKQVDSFKNANEYPNYFKLTNTGQKFPEGKGFLDLGIVMTPECREFINNNPGASLNQIEAACSVRINAGVNSIESDGERDPDQVDREPRIFGATLGVAMRKIQEALTNVGSNTHDWLTSISTTEEFLLGMQGSGQNSNDGDSYDHNNPACLAYKNQTVDIPSGYNELNSMICQVAQDKANSFVAANPQHADVINTEDLARMLYGITRIEGSPFLDAMVTGQSTVSCGDLIQNTCGALQITGILIPACIDPISCSGASDLAGDEVTYNPTTICSISGSFETTLNTRLRQSQYLKDLLTDAGYAEGSAELRRQFYYAMAGRNLGLEEEVLASPACEGAAAVQGCNELNYCECAMDGWTSEFQGCDGLL